MDDDVEPLDLTLDADTVDILAKWCRRVGLNVTRASKLNMPVLRRMETLLAKGVSFNQTCEASGIHPETMRRWMNAHAAVRLFLRTAETVGIEALLDTVIESKDPHAALKLLQTKNGYGQRHRLTPEEEARKFSLEMAKREAEITLLKEKAAAERARARAMTQAGDDVEALLNSIAERQKRKGPGVVDVEAIEVKH